MAGQLQISVLGELRIASDGLELSLPPSKKTRALLAYLVVSGRPQRRERLCDMFWEVPDDPRGALRWSLSKIRQIVNSDGEERLTADRNNVSLRGDGIDLDVSRLVRLRKDDIETLGTSDLEAAAGVFRGRFLEDLYLSHCPPFEAWRVSNADEFDILRMRILRVLVDRLSGEPARALTYLHTLRDLDPENALLAREAERLIAAARQRAGAIPTSRSDQPLPLASEAAAVPPVLDSVASDIVAPSNQEETENTRKRISVLAAEIINPLLAFDEADPEVVMDAVDPLLDLAVEVLAHHGGTVVSRGQAELTAIFGPPAPVEDHARQACRAVLALKSAVEAFADGASRVRASVDTGEAIVRIRTVAHGSRVEVNGPPIRVARQLTQALRRSLIAATERTREAAGGHILMQRLPISEYPTFARDLRVNEVLGENKAFSRWDLRASQGLTPLVGRDAELRLLFNACQRAREGHGQVVGIVAEPGMGKSRLSHELLASEAVRGFTILESGAFENEAAVGFQAMQKLLRAFFEINEDDNVAAVVGTVLNRLGNLDADPRMRSPLLFAAGLPVQDSEWASLGAADRARRVCDAAAAILALEARRRPVVVLIEDLHWIDPESEAVLTRIVDSIHHQRVLLIITHRTEYRHAWSQTSVFSQLRLDPLGPTETSALLHTLLGDDPSVANLIALLAARADGMPLFIEEAVRALAQRGALVGEPGHYTVREDVRDVDVPPNLQSVIAARLDHLPDAERRVLQAAAVIGRDVPLDLLGRMVGVGSEDLEDKVRHLQATNLLYESQTFPARRYTFKHALVQKVTFESILAARRRDIHARFIEIVETEYPDLVDEFLEVLSEHAVRAEAWERAVRYLLRSAQKALYRSAHNSALSYLQRGLAILARWPETPERCRIELEYQKTRGLAWMAAKGWGAPEVSDAYERAEALCALLDDRSELFAALRGRAQYYMISGRPTAAQDLGHRCLEITAGVQDEGIIIETHHIFWTNFFFMGNCAAAAEHAGYAIERYEPDRDHVLTFSYSGHDPGVCSRCFSGLALWQQGKLGLATQHSKEALALAERFSHPLTTALACWGLSYLHIFRREPEAALQWAEREIEICDEYMLPLLQSQGLFQAGWAMAQIDGTAGGLAQMERGLAAIRATGAEMGLPYFTSLLSECYLKSGDIRQACRAINEAITSAQRNGAHFQLSELLRLKAEATSRLKGSDSTEIEALFRSGIETARRQGARIPELRVAISYARYLLDRKRRTEAASVIRPYLEFISEIQGSVDAEAAAELV